MERLVIDETLPGKRLNLKTPAELVDGTGRVVAVVEPQPDPAVFDLTDDVSEEGLERRANSRNWIPADEIVPRLRKLV